jgi:hypothetical protein
LGGAKKPAQAVGPAFGWPLLKGKKGQTYTRDRPDGYDIHPSFLLLSAA